MKYSAHIDTNGNKRLRAANHRGGFSVQSNGNLPRIHSQIMYVKGLVYLKAPEVMELTAYVEAYGTARQKRIMGV